MSLRFIERGGEKILQTYQDGTFPHWLDVPVVAEREPREWYIDLNGVDYKHRVEIDIKHKPGTIRVREVLE